MSNPNRDKVNKNSDLTLTVRYIAEGTRQIVDAIKTLENDNSLSFEENVKKISTKSELEKQELNQEFHENRERIKQRFNRKLRRN